MTTAGSGAVFFLGTRAHYQVLQQPESQFDAENGNAAAATVYQERSALWPDECQLDNYVNGSAQFTNHAVGDDKNNSIKRRNKRRPSETALCEDMKPSALNNVDGSAKWRGARLSLGALAAALARRRPQLGGRRQLHQLHQLHQLQCTYRESCRCLDCQSRYFECDEDEEDYSSEDDSEYLYYLSRALQSPTPTPPAADSDDDEVFIDKVPEDNTSTDMLLEPKKMSVSSTETDPDAPDTLNLEVAAGTPVLLNYLLTHPITCSIQ